MNSTTSTMRTYSRISFGGLFCVIFLFVSALETLSARDREASSGTVVRESLEAFAPVGRNYLHGAIREQVFNVDVARVAAELTGLRSIEIRHFPIAPEQHGAIRLERVRPVADANTEVIADDGKSSRRVRMPAVQAFRGNIIGDDASYVFVSQVGGSMFAAIHHGDGRQFILAPQAGADDASLYGLVDAPRTLAETYGGQFTCGTEHPDHHSNGIAALKQGSDELLLDEKLIEVELAVDCDATVFELFNRDLDRQIEYISAMYAMISNIYESEVNITFYLKHLYIWTGAPEDDPYSGSDDVFGLLDEVRDYWRAKRSRVKRDLVQLVTVNSNSNIGGVAYPGQPGVGTLCNNSFGYSVIGIYGTFNYPTPAYTWDAVSAAHELGHNFSSPHTHSCFWGDPLDTCVIVTSGQDRNSQCINAGPRPAPGSIMSYCHLFNGEVRVNFLEPVAGLIRAGAEANRGDCVGEPRNPHISMIAPLGDGGEYPLGEELEIQWVSARVSSVAISYSTDLGATWTEIARDVDASLGNWTWSPSPAIGAQANVILRVADASDESVFDQTWGTFILIEAGVQVLTPNAGETAVVGSSIRFEWIRRAVGAVDIHLRVVGGAEWTEIASGVEGDEFTWTATPIWAGEQVEVRVSQAGNSEVSDQADAPFTVVMPTLELLEPAAGDILVIGEPVEITWRSEYLARVRLQFIDGTDTSTIHPSLNAANESQRWTITAGQYEPTLNGYIRIVGLQAVETVSAVVGPLTLLGDDPVLNIDDKQKNQAGLEVISLAPNPARDRFVLKFSARRPLQNVKISLVDLRGRVALERVVLSSAVGEEHSVQFDCAAIASGAYTLILESEVGRTGIPLVIGR